MSAFGLRGALTVDDLRRKAQRRVPKMVTDLVAGGAESELTLRRNRSAFDEIVIEPNYLVDVGRRDLSTSILGMPVESPVMFGPTGLSTLIHRDGELALARAAGAAGSIYVLSVYGGYSLEEVAAAASGILWFQVYLWKDRGVTRELLQRAKAAGYRAAVLTVDVPVNGQRERDLRRGLTVPIRITPRTAIDVALRPWWLYRIARHPLPIHGSLRGIPGAGGDSGTGLIEYANRDLLDPTQSWKDLEWLREIWDEPLAVKGVMSVGDAQRTVERGAEAVWVSNHGGRQLDGARASIEALPRIVDAVGDRAEILFDGGVRRGTDVVKAIGLGARACAVGRPYWWGLGAAGEDGARRVLEILNSEVSRVMALSGVTSLAEIDRSIVQAPSEWTA
ncbi:MAG TPA: alpha-hydroxy acid oxidase [Solirubrobacteraceae bacterium]|jgi:L-lactate dehydrogenase (cytochrome)